MKDWNREATPKEMELKAIGDMSFNEMKDEIASLRRKVSHASGASQRAAEVADKLREVIKQLASLATELMPAPGSAVHTGRKNRKYDELVDTLYVLMQNGTVITTDIVERADHDLRGWQVKTILNKLKNRQGVVNLSDGGRGNKTKLTYKG